MTMIVNYKRGMIKSYFSDLEKDYTVDFIDEDVFMGTGGGLCLLKGRMDSPFSLPTVIPYWTWITATCTSTTKPTATWLPWYARSSTM